MGRRIFEEHKFDVTGKVLSYEDYKPFIFKPEGFKINPEHNEEIIKRAESILDKEYPVLIASDFMMFKRDGNRSIYQGKCFPRRADMLTLALAEYVGGKGRFADKLTDLVWMILEETSWVIPAHNPGKDGVPYNLPYAYTGEVDYIDLFSATTAASLSWVYYLCKDVLDNVSPVIVPRMLFELNRRIVEPFNSDKACREKMGWTGVKGNRVNNWNPWIVSNVLTVCALTVKDMETREKMVARAIPMLDCFTSVYHDDGGCDEGPGYWGAAGGALFSATLVLYDLTGGYVNIYDNPLFKNMGEYEVKVIVSENRVLNFADCAGRMSPNASILYEWGVLCNSEMMKTYGQYRLSGNLPKPVVDSNHPYRSFLFLTETRQPKAEFVPPLKFWLDGIVIAGTRESLDVNKGLYVALKGGHNGESHNHNDVGTVVVFADGQPIFLDAGSGTYTRRTFSPERYTIWAMRSDYHNVATVNGVVQNKGAQACSSDHVYDEASGKLTISLKNAYETEADIESYTRSAVLENSVVTIEDDITLGSDGNVMFSYICNMKPENVTENSFEIHGRTVTFDPSLEYGVEAIDCTWPEVERIPRVWDCEEIYRVTLKNKAPFKSKTFVLTVK